MLLWEIAQTPLFPPVARFFAGVLLIIAVEAFILLFVLYLWSKYGKEE